MPGSTIADRQPRYSGMAGGRLSRPAGRRLALVAAALLAGLGMGGCSYRLGGLAFQDGDKADHTGSLKPGKIAEGANLPAAADLALAKAAVNDLLSRGESDTSLPWENPRTGARGTVTPIASAYTQDGFVCRDFLASYVRAGNESWLQGEACRLHQGKWEVKAIRPLQRT